MEKEKVFFKIINEICIEKGIQQDILSYGWIRRLTKNGISRNIVHYQFDLNSASSYNIAGDKYATFEILKNNNIPTIDHYMIFNPNTRSNLYNENYKNIIDKLFISNKYVVIKANNSYQGKDVFLCRNVNDTESIIKKLFLENDTLSLCPFYDIKYEYRIIYLCGKIIYAYKKRKPYIIGNGVDTLNQLIKKKEYDLNNVLKDIDLNYIPKKNEEITISWKHNLSNGAIPILIDENDIFLDEIKKIAIKSGNAINIKFASIDIALTSDNKMLVMEINSSVCMNKFTELIPNGYKIAKEIYSRAIEEMFKN